MDEVLIYAKEYGRYLVVFLSGMGFGYFLTIGLRCKEIAQEVWKAGAHDCSPFMTPPYAGPVKFIAVALGVGLTLYDTRIHGNDAYLYGLTSFAIGLAWAYNLAGDKEKPERIVPGIYSRLKIRRNQLKTVGERARSDKLSEFLKRLEERYPRLTR